MEKLTKAQIKEQRKLEREQLEAQMTKEEKLNKWKKIGMWVGGALILVLAFWGLMALASTPQTPQGELISPKITNADITTGPKNAKVTLVEYADFQCPACKAYFPLVQQLHKDFQGKVLFVYRFFPLTQIHQNAMVSAQAAYAANKQGKFWEMHDLLFANQDAWATQLDPKPIFDQYAEKLGLDTTQFNADYNSQEAKNFINSQEDGGTNAGVNATPTFFLNNKQIANPAGYDAFKQEMQNALNGK